MDRAVIEEFVERNRDDAIALLETLGKIPAPSHHEDQRAAFCRDWFVLEGVDDVWIDEAKNVVCRFGPASCDSYVVFAAHMDVVFDDTEALPMRREGSRLFAPGIGDDTANLVNLMMGCRFLLEHRDELEQGVLIVANTCEEGLGNLKGVKQLFSNYEGQIERFHSFDGYLSQCTSIPVGTYRYRLSIHARGGHSYLEFGNANAVQQAAELICELYRIEPPTREYTSYNVGRIEGGSTVNSIPTDCSLLYEYRSSDAGCLEEMRQKMRRVVERARLRGVQLHVSTIGVRPGASPGLDRAALRRFTDDNIDVIRSWFDGGIDETPYGTDSNWPLSLGVIANTIGTVAGEYAHTRQEWVDLNSLPTGMAIVCDLIGRYVGRVAC